MAFLDVLGAIASPIASLIGAGTSAINMNQQKQLMQQNNEFQAAENQKNREWQSQEWTRQFDLVNAYNDPSALVERLKKASLNPSTLLSGSAGAQAGRSSALPSAPSGGVSATPSPDYSGIITSGFQSMQQIANSIKMLTEAKKTAKEGSKIDSLIDSQIAKNLGEGANQQAQAAQAEFNLQLDKIFGVKLREESLSKLVADVKQIYADIEVKGSEVSLNEVKEFESKSLALLHLAERSLSEENVRQLKELLDFKKSALRASVTRDIAEAGKFSAEAATENALRDYRVAISKAESLIKGNQSNISAATWKDVVEQVRQAATAAGLANEDKVQDVLLKGKNLDYRDAQEVRNWIKTIQGFIPLTSALPME